jgi:hypothetical protein
LDELLQHNGPQAMESEAAHVSVLLVRANTPRREAPPLLIEGIANPRRDNSPL